MEEIIVDRAFSGRQGIDEINGFFYSTSMSVLRKAFKMLKVNAIVTLTFILNIAIVDFVVIWLQNNTHFVHQFVKGNSYLLPY